MGKLKTPDWVLKGEKPPAKKKSKTFKIKKCPECGNTDVSVVLGGEDGEGSRGWECKACKWKGKEIKIDEVGEEGFLEAMEEIE